MHCEWEANHRSDYEAAKAGYISVTPLQADLTDIGAIAFTEALTLAAGDVPPVS